MTSTHRQIAIVRNGGPSVLQLQEVPTPAPVGDQVRVRVDVAGVAFGDVLLREGIRRQPRPPVVPGYDVAGVVDAVGPDGPRGLLGKRVAAWTGGAGGYSEVVIAPSWAVASYADGIEPADALSVVLNYVTAWQMLHRVARSRAGDRILVHGAAGGVGTALLQLARHLDIEAYGTASPGKHELVRMLGGIPIDYTTEDFVNVLAEVGGADAVFDPIGGAHWRRSMQALAGGGILVAYGFSAATRDGRRTLRAAIPALVRQPVATPVGLMQRGRVMAGYRIERLAEERPDQFSADLHHLLDLLASGGIRPLIDARYPLEEAARAQADLASNRPVGKYVLTVSDAGLSKPAL